MIAEYYYNIRIIADKKVKYTIPALLGSVYKGDFLETSTGWEIGISDINNLETVLKVIRNMQEQFSISFKVKYRPVENWNKQWEKSLSPIYMDNFLQICMDDDNLRDEFQYTIRIFPQNAFGTGHHSTTYCSLKLMREINFSDMKVLDLGCGTGILGILAIKMGAAEVEFLDKDAQSIRNTIENLQRNFILENYSLTRGTLEEASSQKYDIILANIYRNTHLRNRDRMRDICTSELLLSGYRKNGTDDIEKAFAEAPWRLKKSFQQDSWVAQNFYKKKK